MVTVNILSLIAQKLEDEGFGTVDTDIHEGMPLGADEAGAVPENAIFVFSAPSQPGIDEAVSGYPNKFRYPQTVIRVRHTSFSTGQTNAQTIMDKLGPDTTSVLLGFFFQESVPLYIGRDDDGLHEWTLNVITPYDWNPSSGAGLSGDGALWFDNAVNSHHIATI